LIEFEESIAEGVAALLMAGHRLADIRTYTLRQLQGFSELAVTQEKLRLQSYGAMTRAAMNADKKQWVQIMKEFNDG
jgi:hypothetical protein